MTTPRILAFGGSLRQDSFNQRMVHVAAEAARAAGAEVTVLHPRDHPLPLYDQDLEEAGRPAGVDELKAIFRAHDGLLIASPEYNSSVSAALKNLIDWVSRPDPDEPPLSCFRGKFAGIMSASPGGLGGLRGLVHLRAILGNIQVTVLPDQHALKQAHEAFGSAGMDASDRERIEAIGRRLTDVLRRLKD